MKSTRSAALLLAATALLAACDNTAEVRPVTDPAGGALFARYVAIGNSITAGWQSGGINDSTQRESYALYLARQMGHSVGPTMESSFIYPSFPIPGCPAPVANFATQARLGAPNNPPCTLRAATTELVNNVAVPGATVTDPTSTAGNPTSSAINQFILGGRTQVDRAAMAQPTFTTIWIGNNDVLSAGLG
ncbi:MAG TPA: SGNH/GDSL hydrolase family protein, partial [Gemmatimonadaceae bacterium]|nr:SGNH/GDSL hydrolase family protein [Gemmatimonadaceae bacterium]